MANPDRYLEDVVEDTNISERNVKYWSQKYDLPVEKDGRRNVYPPRTVTLLRLVKLLSDSELFTHHFIRIQVQRALGRASDEIEKVEDYRDVRKRARELLQSIDTRTGDQVLPALEGQSSRKRKSRRRAAKNGGDLDEGVL